MCWAHPTFSLSKFDVALGIRHYLGGMTVSVLIPCYNAAPFLAQALDSVFAQTRPPNQVVVVDDGSSDGSVDIARRYPVHLCCLPANTGHGRARNEGLRAVTSDAVAMLDADDFWEPTHLAEVVGLLERHPEAVLASSHAQAFGTKSFRVDPNFPIDSPDATFRAAFDYWIAPHNGLAIRTAALREVGGYCETERLALDYDLILRLAYRFPFVAGERVTVWWRWHPSQLSSQHHLQRLAVRRHRARFIEWLRSEGEIELAAELERRAFELWLRDLVAFRTDARLLRAHLAERAGLRDVPRSTLIRWHVRAVLGVVYYARGAKPLRAVYRKVRRFLAQQRLGESFCSAYFFVVGLALDEGPSVL